MIQGNPGTLMARSGGRPLNFSSINKKWIKQGALVGMAATGVLLVVWGVSSLNPPSGHPLAQNGMGGPAEPPLSSLSSLNLQGSFLKAPGVDVLPPTQLGPVFRPDPSREIMTIAPGQTFYEALVERGAGHEDIMALVKACGPFRNLKNVRAGETFRIQISDDGGIESLGFDLDEESYVTWVRAGDSYQRLNGTYPVQKRLRAVCGTIENSLYASLEKVGAPLALAPKMNDILGWDLDFNRDLRKGDTFRILYEEVFKEGRRVRTGAILGVELVNRGQKKQAIAFTTEDGRSHYFNAEGKNLQKQLMRAPLQYSRISSKFTYRRFHPVLKKWMPHLGVDYAAPLGTPVVAGGDGVITACSVKKGNGRYIRVRHTNAEYETYYLHLSRFAKGIAKGTKVSQGQVIGYVGATGYATGPHLDYRVKRNGKFVNPRTLKLPAAKPVDSAQMARFQEKAHACLGILDALALGNGPVDVPLLALTGTEEGYGPLLDAASLETGPPAN